MEAKLEKACDREKEILAIRAILVYTAECAKDLGDEKLVRALQRALLTTNECLHYN
ncbi:MAG: hypothetical protein AB8B62_07755 [Roseobacter sp.]